MPNPTTAKPSDADPDPFDRFDAATRAAIAAALWQPEFNASALPADVAAGLLSDTNSPAAWGARMREFLVYLLDHPLSHTPDRTHVYERLLDHCSALSPQQVYVWQTSLLGPAATVGYDMIPTVANLEFPRDHAPKFTSQVGWHFFVGSAWDTDGVEYGVEMMLFGAAIFPPHIAAGFGLSPTQNQVIELQLAISEAGGRHYQAEPVVLAGTSGLLGFTEQPLVFRLGRNVIECHDPDSFFPVTVQAWGVDRAEEGGASGDATTEANSVGVELGIDLRFSSGKAPLLQGANGLMPSIDGIGSLYYSIPNLVLEGGSSLTLDGRTVQLARGQFWFDHQWGYLTGAPRSSVMRAATYSKDPEPSGWDWFMAQFVGDRQLTMFCPHASSRREFYEQSGPTPPGVMSVNVRGTYMAADATTHMATGALRVTDWVKATGSMNPKRYLVTDTWYPNRWEFVFDESVPADIREFTMTPIVRGAQSGFFANGAQYAEGAVVLTDPQGADIGRGFAESVSFADTRRTVHRLAGLGESEADIAAFSMRTTPKPLALFNTGYVLAHRNRLAEIMAAAAGMEFFPTE